MSGKEHAMPESNLIPEQPTEPPAAEGQLAAVLPLRDIVVFRT